MKVISRVQPLPKFMYLKNPEPISNEFAAAIDKIKPPNFDKLILSKEGQTQGLTTGERNEEIFEPWVPDELEIVTGDPNEIFPWRIEEAASKGIINDYFFRADTGFMQICAKELANGNKLPLNAKVNSWRYADSIVKWFYGEDAKKEDFEQMQNSMNDIITELADRIKNNGNTDLRSLNSTFSIHGEKVTLGDVMDMQEVGRKIVDEIAPRSSGVGWGTGMYRDFAEKGIMKAAVSSYSSTLPPALGKMFESSYSKLIDSNAQKCLKEAAEDPDNPVGGKLNKMSEQIYNIFSKIDFSSASSQKTSFQRAYDQYAQIVKANGQGGYLYKAKEDLEKILNNAANVLNN